MSKTGYEKLQEDERLPRTQSIDSLLDCVREEAERSFSPSHRGEKWRGRIWMLHSTLILFNLILAAVLLAYNFSVETSELGAYEYLPFRDIVHTQTQYWDLTLGIPTDYTKPAGPEVDALWDEITAPPGKVGRVKAQKDDLHRANMTSIPLADGSGYFATLDVFHQLHCLDLFRRALADDSYPNKPQTTHMWEEHRDHCIDSLRLSLQCQSDLSIIGFKWVKDYYKPWPDFRGYHKCRNWDDILSWAQNHMLPIDEPHTYVHPEIGLIDGVHVPHDSPLKDGKIEWIGPNEIDL